MERVVKANFESGDGIRMTHVSLVLASPSCEMALQGRMCCTARSKLFLERYTGSLSSGWKALLYNCAADGKRGHQTENFLGRMLQCPGLGFFVGCHAEYCLTGCLGALLSEAAIVTETHVPHFYLVSLLMHNPFIKPKFCTQLDVVNSATQCQRLSFEILFAKACTGVLNVERWKFLWTLKVEKGNSVRIDLFHRLHHFKGFRFWRTCRELYYEPVPQVKGEATYSLRQRQQGPYICWKKTCMVRDHAWYTNKWKKRPWNRLSTWPFSRVLFHVRASGAPAIDLSSHTLHPASLGTKSDSRMRHVYMASEGKASTISCLSYPHVDVQVFRSVQWASLARQCVNIIHAILCHHHTAGCSTQVCKDGPSVGHCMHYAWHILRKRVSVFSCVPTQLKIQPSFSVFCAQTVWEQQILEGTSLQTRNFLLCAWHLKLNKPLLAHSQKMGNIFIGFSLHGKECQHNIQQNKLSQSSLFRISNTKILRILNDACVPVPCNMKWCRVSPIDDSRTPNAFAYLCVEVNNYFRHGNKSFCRVQKAILPVSSVCVVHGLCDIQISDRHEFGPQAGKAFVLFNLSALSMTHSSLTKSAYPVSAWQVCTYFWVRINSSPEMRPLYLVFLLERLSPSYLLSPHIHHCPTTCQYGIVCASIQYIPLASGLFIHHCPPTCQHGIGCALLHHKFSAISLLSQS